MPTYEYACRSCEERIEVVQSFADDPLTECPSCGGELRKVFSAAGLIFKGSGWHIKDYSSSGSSSTKTSSSDSTGAKPSSSDSTAKDPSSSTSTGPSTSTASSSGD
jgi:putative FmdB family regulatory protein